MSLIPYINKLNSNIQKSKPLDFKHTKYNSVRILTYFLSPWSTWSRWHWRSCTSVVRMCLVQNYIPLWSLQFRYSSSSRLSRYSTLNQTPQEPRSYCFQSPALDRRLVRHFHRIRPRRRWPSFRLRTSPPARWWRCLLSARCWCALKQVKPSERKYLHLPIPNPSLKEERMTEGFISRFPTVVVAENSRVSVGFVAVRGDVLLPTRVPAHEDTRLGSEAVHTGQELCSIRPR